MQLICTQVMSSHNQNIITIHTIRLITIHNIIQSVLKVHNW